MIARTSRRSFLGTAARGIAMTWGGLRLFAGSGAIAGPVSRTVPSREVPQQLFIYGSAFYRPPNPPAGERRSMLKAMAEKYQFNAIRIYSAWVYHHLEANRFDFTELEEVLGYCDEFGIRVLLGVILEDAPYWLEAAHPETRYVNANGQPQRLGVTGNNVSGGWPGLCLDWTVVRESAAQFIHELTKVASAHPSQYAYDCWNEAHLEPAWPRSFPQKPEDVAEVMYCYCPQTLLKFQHWLQNRYGTIEHLNEAWIRRYTQWSQIDPPREQGTYLDWLDWRRFIIERNTQELGFRASEIRSIDKRSVLECHVFSQSAVMPIAASGVNAWRLAETMQVWGLSCFPRAMGSFHLNMAKLELTRCQAGVNPFWMTELQGGHFSNGLAPSPAMRPRDIRLWNWLAVAAGAKGILYWAYDTEATGTEAGGFGLLARDGSPTERIDEAAADRRLIESYWGLIKDYRPSAELALLFDQDNALLNFAMAGDEDASTKSFCGYYKAFWNYDIWVDFIEPTALPESRYKVIVAPWHLLGKKETCQHLYQFVVAGGTLILESGFGMFDERTFYNPIIPPHGLTESFGYREIESVDVRPSIDRDKEQAEDLSPSDRIYIDAHLELTAPIKVRVKAHTSLSRLAVGCATVIAEYDGLPVAIHSKVGRGQVYYLGTNFGASIEDGDLGGQDWLHAVLAPLTQPTVTAEGLRPRLIEGAHQSLLVVVNEGPEDRRSSIKVPARYRHATDLYANEKQAVREQTVTANVPFHSLVVLLLE